MRYFMIVLSVLLLPAAVSPVSAQLGCTPTGSFHPHSALAGPGPGAWEPFLPSSDEEAWRMTEAVYENWVTDGWQNSTRATYTYSSDLLSELLFETWSGGAWTESTRYLYTWDGEDRNTEVLLQTWSGSSWQNSHLTTNTYTGDLLDQALGQTWSGSSWTNGTLTTYTYQSGKISQVLFQSWSAADGWTNGYLYTYEYQGDDISEILAQSWSGSSWINYSLTTYTYSGGRLSEVLSRLWSGSVWEYSTHSAYTYAGDQLTTMLMRQWQSGGWENWYRYDYWYDEFGNNDETITRTWSGSVWVNSTRITYSWESWQGMEGSGPVDGIHLGAPFPCPSTSAVAVVLTMPSSGYAMVCVYDLGGDLVAVLEDGMLAEGSHQVTWDGDAPQGIYMVRLTTPGTTASRKVLLLGD